MSYQIRHKEFGIFQGHFMGMSFWYDENDPEYPEQGLARYETEVDAQNDIDVLCSENCASPETYIGKLSIEPFDEELNDKCMELLRGLKANEQE